MKRKEDDSGVKELKEATLPKPRLRPLKNRVKTLQTVVKDFSLSIANSIYAIEQIPKVNKKQRGIAQMNLLNLVLNLSRVANQIIREEQEVDYECFQRFLK